jgi:hypothetical protein
MSMEETSFLAGTGTRTAYRRKTIRRSIFENLTVWKKMWSFWIQYRTICTPYIRCNTSGWKLVRVLHWRRC